MVLSNSQYEQLMRHYTGLQLSRQHLSRERKQEVYAALPEVRAIDEAIAAAGISSAIARLNAGDEDAEAVTRQEATSLHETISALSVRKQTLLREAGFPDGYLDPPYTCPDCCDTGFIDGLPCHCYTQAALDLAYDQSHLKEVLQRENFDHFSLDCYSGEIKNEKGLSSRENAQNVLKLAHQYVDTFASEHGNLLILGGTGTGKTFLSHCIARSILDQGFSVIYLSSLDFFRVFEDAAFHRTGDRSGYDNIFSCDLLIIDDLGTEISNSFTNGNLFDCINQRQLAAKATVISTNFSLNQLGERYSERVYARIYSNFNVIKLFGQDIRISNKLKKLS